MIATKAPDRYEQTCFNVAVHESLGAFHQLPIAWNWFHGFYDRLIGTPPEPPRMLHFVSMMGAERWKAFSRALDGIGIIPPIE
jgi:hypothetical protein